MILSSHNKENHLVIKILKDIMMDNSKDFFKEFELIFNKENTYKVISFDFTKVNFMDSSGIGSLIRAATFISNSGASVAVFNLNKPLYSVFRLSGLDNILNIYTLEEFHKQYPEFK